MSFSDSNRVGIRIVAETTWGTTPAGPVMQALNLSSESLKSNVQTVTSDTIRDDRNVSDITNVGGGAGGDLGIEFRYAEYDELLEAGMQGTWVTTRVSAALASAYFSGATIRGDSSSLTAMVSGYFLRVTGATTGTNDGDFRIGFVPTSGGATKLTLTTASSGAAASFASEVFAAGTTMKGKNLRNGVIARSFTVEKEFSDVSSFAQYAGMRVTAFNLNMETQSILTGTLSMMGKSQVAASATLASTLTAANTNTVMNASNNVGKIWEGGQAVSGIAFQSIAIALSNNPRDQAKVGSSDLVGIATGRAEVTGSFNAYMENNSLITKFTAGTKTNLRFQVDDIDGNSYIIDIPRVTFQDMTIAATGPNNDVIQDGSWGASIDLTGTYAIQITALDV